VVEKKEYEPQSIERGETGERATEESPAVESYVEKVEKKLGRVPRGVPGPADDQVVVVQPASQQPPVILPITQKGMQNGAGAKVQTGLAWLFTWARRQVAMAAKLGRKVILRELPEVKKEQI